MNDAPMISFAFLVGIGLGAVFFGGLWWTLRKAMTSKQPALWFASSLFVRVGVTLSGFYFVSADHGPRFLGCLLGFTISRAAITRLVRPTERHRSAPPEVNHAAHS